MMEPAIAQIGQEYLQRLGYRVTALTSSTQAWQEFQAQPGSFDLVITDLTMPGMTGSSWPRPCCACVRIFR